MPKRLVWPSILFGLACACGGTAREPVRAPPGGEGGGGEFPPGCDADGDGVASLVCGGDDCDDSDRAVHPGADDVCGDGLDQDCSGAADEDCACVPGDARGCWPAAAPPEKRHVGRCADGFQLCDSGGAWGPCDGAVVPDGSAGSCELPPASCDVPNACGLCEAEPVEVCGNALDDDCDGVLDDPALCRFACADYDPANPDTSHLSCCLVDPASGLRAAAPVRHSGRCVEAEGMPACEDDARRCLVLEEGAACEKRCTESGCVCGVVVGEEVVVSAACGFETPCAYLGCDGRSDQPCYGGPPRTMGVGICRGGRSSCLGEAGWGACEGEILPRRERCGNGLDDDCDGEIDEEDGASGARCAAVPRCAPDSLELCGNGLDDDCDGAVDERCPADSEEQACYRGPPATRGVGACRDGIQRRRPDGGWGPCEGDVLPGGECCGDGVDSDCDGFGGPGQREAAGCPAPPAPESCNGIDDDGDGLVDEELVNACGTCGESCASFTFLVPASCAASPGRRCDGVTAARGDPATLAAAPDKRAGDDGNYLYVPYWELEPDGSTVTGVYRFDTDARRIESRIVSHGFIRFIQVMPDNSVWLSSNGEDDAYGAIEHFDRHGNRICRTVVYRGIGQLAAAPDGGIWLSSGLSDKPDPTIQGQLLLVHGSRVEPTQPDGTPWPDGVARCTLIDLAPEDPTAWGLELVAGWSVLGIDHRGILWAHAALDELGWPRRLRLDTRTMQAELISGSIGRFNAFDDEAAAWSKGPSQDTFGSWVHSDLLRTAPDGPYARYPDELTHETRWPELPFGAFVFDREGKLWGRGPGVLVRFDPETGSYRELRVPETSPHPKVASDWYIGIDRAGRLWSIVDSNLLNTPLAVYDPAKESWEVVPMPGVQLADVPTNDPTGTMLRRARARTGTWRDVHDGGHPQTRWTRLDWQEHRPAGTAVTAYVRFADSLEALDAGSTIACGPFRAPPADLRSCDAAGRRYAEVEIVLESSGEGESALVRDVELQWSRP